MLRESFREHSESEISCIQLSEHHNAVLYVVKERMNLDLEVGGGSNDVTLKNLDNLFTTLSEYSIKSKEKQEKFPFLNLIMKFQFYVNVEKYVLIVLKALVIRRQNSRQMYLMNMHRQVI